VGGYLGEEKTLGCLKERFYWPGHFIDVRNWCQTCPSYVPHKTAPVREKAPLQNIQTGYPMQDIPCRLSWRSRSKSMTTKYVHGRPLEPNTLAWLHSTVIPRGGPKKPHHPWTGSWQVLKRISDATF